MKYITTLLIAALATSLTAAPPEGGKGKKPGLGGPRRGPPASVIKQFDADGDGKLNQAEQRRPALQWKSAVLTASRNSTRTATAS